MLFHIWPICFEIAKVAQFEVYVLGFLGIWPITVIVFMKEIKGWDTKSNIVAFIVNLVIAYFCNLWYFFVWYKVIVSNKKINLIEGLLLLIACFFIVELYWMLALCNEDILVAHPDGLSFLEEKDISNWKYKIFMVMWLKTLVMLPMSFLARYINHNTLAFTNKNKNVLYVIILIFCISLNFFGFHPNNVLQEYYFTTNEFLGITNEYKLLRVYSYEVKSDRLQKVLAHFLSKLDANIYDIKAFENWVNIEWKFYINCYDLGIEHGENLIKNDWQENLVNFKKIEIVPDNSNTFTKFCRRFILRDHYRFFV